MASRKQLQRLRDAEKKANSTPRPQDREACGFCEDGVTERAGVRSECPYCGGLGFQG